MDKKITQICNFVFPYYDKWNDKIIGLYGKKGLMKVIDQIKQTNDLLWTKIIKQFNFDATTENFINITNTGNICGKLLNIKYVKNFWTKIYN